MGERASTLALATGRQHQQGRVEGRELSGQQTQRKGKFERKPSKGRSEHQGACLPAPPLVYAPRELVCSAKTHWKEKERNETSESQNHWRSHQRRFKTN